MMRLKPGLVASQALDLVHSLVYHGMSTVTPESIREIEFLLQNASFVKAYRLATSLRYLHVELKRFLEHQAVFNLERYAFFLSNIWIIGTAMASGHDPPAGGDPAIVTRPASAPPATPAAGLATTSRVPDIHGHPANMEEPGPMELLLVGLEKVHLEKVMFGIVFHFLRVDGEAAGTILQYNMFFQPMGMVNPEMILVMDIQDNPCMRPADFFNGPVAVEGAKIVNGKVLEVTLEPRHETHPFNIPETSTPRRFPLELIEPRYDIPPARIKAMLDETIITPFDAVTTAERHVFLKNVVVKDHVQEGRGKGKYKSVVHVFSLGHEQEYKAKVRIPDKPVNKTLVEAMERLQASKRIVPGMMAKLDYDRGTIAPFPLAFVDGDGKVTYPCLQDGAVQSPSRASR